jgi:hypothetical protein
MYLQFTTMLRLSPFNFKRLHPVVAGHGSRCTPQTAMATRAGADIARRDLVRLLQGGNMVLREAMRMQVSAPAAEISGKRR